MLKFGNKEFRNLQEQVKKNMDDILFILQEEGVLNEFGIKVVGQEASVANMPTVADYKEDNPDWSYGDAYAIGTDDPYTLYILTRANGTHPNDYWFNIGQFPVAGPQGPQGPQGDVGPQGPTGPTGANGLSAGFGTVSGTAETVSYGSDATVQIVTSGPDTAKNIQFTFGIPEGRPGEAGAGEWGEITGDLEDQTDLFTALQAKQNTLVSGTNIKTINNESILGSGNIDIQVSGDVTDVEVNGVSVVGQDGVAQIDLTGYVESSDLATVATSGSYNDLSDKPSIPSVSGTNDGTNWTSITINNDTYAIPAGGGTGTITDVEVNGVSVVTGGVAEVTVPTKVSDLTNDSGFITSSALSGYATESWVGQQGFITGITSSDVISALGYTPGTSNFSGAYDDLTGKPTIPTATSELTNDSGFITSSALTGYATESYVQGYHDSTKQDVISDLATIRSGAALGATAVQPAAISDMATQTWVGNQGYLTGITSSDVTTALGYVPGTSNFSGAYADLTGKPDLSIYAETANLGDCAFLDENELSIAYSQITGTPTIPSKTSDLTNDSGFITSSDIPVTDVQVDGVSVITNKVASITLPSLTLSNTEYSSPDYTLKGIEIGGEEWALPSVPTNVSAFTNDAGYITSSALSGYATETWVGQQGYQTASDVSTAVSTAISGQTKETWTFTLSDGTTTTKTIVLG